MKRNFLILNLLLLGLICGVFAVQAQGKKSAAKAPKSIHIDVSKDKVGGESSRFLSMVGDWMVVEDGGKKVYAVDGRKWLRGNPARGLAEKARTVYGSKHEDFVDNVKAFAYFPISVAKDIDDFQNGEISVKFKMISGQLDKCSGILFNVKPNGDYLAVRFNGKEDNLVLWTFKQGKRSFVKKGIENVPLELGKWYDMKVAIHGAQIEGYLNGKKLLDYTWSEPIAGKIGLWSKTDSVSYFDEYTVTPMAK